MNIISREIDYAIRILSLLSNIESATVEEISKILYIPKPFAHKIVNKLVKKGYLVSMQGRGGYIGFNKDLDTNKISVLDIMRDLDGYKHVNLCTDDPGACELNPYCSFTYHLQKLELCINKALDDLKLKDIIFRI
ncbi:MAG: RrF2 family transcriptional regulator [Desulfurella sp.]|uniref:RrF2 family transcriptional regulator n=1 Tax=Desulfurella sp. TaxID=1962857 RepID=UPI003D0E7362